MAKKVGGTKERWTGKSMYSIVTPKFLGSKEVGKTMSETENNLIGRTIDVSLTDITGNIKQYQTKIKLKINKIEGKIAYTEYVGQETIRDKIARLVRKWSSRIDEIQDITTKDNKKIRIKSLTISERRINAGLQTKIRKCVNTSIPEWCKEKTLEQVVEDINNFKMQKAIESKASKIYPLRIVEIRMIEVLSS